VTTLALFAQESQGNPLGLIILLLPIAAIIFLTVVPQRRQKRKQAELMANLAVGDEVVTIGGIHGVVNFIEDDVVHLEVDDDVVVKFSLGAVSRTAQEPDPDSAPAQRGGLMGALMGGSTASRDRGTDGDGDSTDGDSTDGDSTDGDSTDGDSTDGDSTDGDSTDSADGDGDGASDGNGNSASSERDRGN
jgi:preprotein translocase subunit YajC